MMDKEKATLTYGKEYWIFNPTTPKKLKFVAQDGFTITIDNRPRWKKFLSRIFWRATNSPILSGTMFHPLRIWNRKLSEEEVEAISGGE